MFKIQSYDVVPSPRQILTEVTVLRLSVLCLFCCLLEHFASRVSSTTLNTETLKHWFWLKNEHGLLFVTIVLFLTRNCSSLISKNFSLIYLWWGLHFDILLCGVFCSVLLERKLPELDLFTYVKILSQTRKHLAWSSAILTVQLHNKT